MQMMAQSRETVSLWTNNYPNSNGKGDVCQMTVYHPAKPNGMAIVMCPGGGYDHLAATHEGHDMAPWMNSLNITYAVLEYRLPYRHEDVPLTDAEQAMKIMRSHAKTWQVDSDKIGIMGASAGGHLAATLATKCREKVARPDFQILLYPVISLRGGITNPGTRRNLLGDHPTENAVDTWSPDRQVTSGTPPAFIALSGDDRTTVPPGGLLYYESLYAQGVPATLHIYPTGGHGWGWKDSFAYKREWTAELEKWLKEIYE
jgi:acetyl esterase/lipase